MPDEREGDPLLRNDLAIDAVLPMLLAVGRNHQRAPFSARARVQLDDRRREVFRTPPLLGVLGIGPDFPDEIERGIESALNHELTLGCCRLFICCAWCGHVCSPYFEAGVNSYPVDRTVPPIGLDSVRPNRILP